jgi:hypothetical protein
MAILTLIICVFNYAEMELKQSLKFVTITIVFQVMAALRLAQLKTDLYAMEQVLQIPQNVICCHFPSKKNQS